MAQAVLLALLAPALVLALATEDAYGAREGQASALALGESNFKPLNLEVSATS
jgi:hypothetical protein